MTLHQILKHEEQLALICLYCGNEIKPEEWKSDFSYNKHYKIAECKSCGRTNIIKAEFIGSGHDKWIERITEEIVEYKDKKDEKTIEDITKQGE